MIKAKIDAEVFRRILLYSHLAGMLENTIHFKLIFLTDEDLKKRKKKLLMTTL